MKIMLPRRGDTILRMNGGVDEVMQCVAYFTSPMQFEVETFGGRFMMVLQDAKEPRKWREQPWNKSE